jgi:hypothetical protein
MRQMMRIFAVLAVALPGNAQAESAKVVVELYTSQGCSSCPPADELLAELSKNDEILPLAFHVDYWDYLGWKDELASPAFTERQKSYAHSAAERTIYTPQVIVNGKVRLVGSDAQALMSAVMHEMNQSQSASLSVSRQDELVTISGTAPAKLDRPVEVLLVRYLPQVSVEIRRGENAGQTITYVNTVTSLTSIGHWSGDRPLLMTTSISGSDSAAILLQEVDFGALLASAVIR